jgi:hypothetical protein
MKNNYSLKRILALFVILVSFHFASAENSSRKLWSKAEQGQLRASQRTWYPNHFESYSLQTEAMRGFLATAPMQENVASRKSSFIIELPMPDGDFNRFTLVESPVMEKGLADAYPEIKTYAGQGVDDPTAYIRLDITPMGFHAFVLSAKGTIYIDPLYLGNTADYIVYYKKDVPKELWNFNCLAGTSEDPDAELFLREPDDVTSTNAILDNKLRTERLALACTGEYADAVSPSTPTIAVVLAAMVTTMNRVNGVYELELDIHMSLVANDTILIFLNGTTDPYTNNSGGTMLTENQNYITSHILSANYDIGHVFSTGGGGIAGLGVICTSTQKARGVTGLPSPVGDAFAIDYVAHEMGHQHGGNHTFNSVTGSCGGGNRSGSSAYEPGSGSTIMAYAGICGSDDLQSNSNDYFHTRSFDEIVTYTQSGTGNSCPVKTNISNTIPTVTVPPSFYVPIKTPFRLTAAGTDADGDTLTYCWEEWDLGGSGQAWNLQTAGVSAPIFRSFLPTTSPTRLFPKLSNILANSTSTGEIKPIYARTLNFRCTVRDHHSIGGGVSHSVGVTSVNVVASDTGGFAILAPNTTGITWAGTSMQTVTWHVAGTTGSPISAANVNIYMSFNSGTTFPDTIAMHVPNTGSYTFSVPNVATGTGRIMVEGDTKIFFDINDRNFTITFTVGVEENQISNNISVYPNPANTEFHCVINSLSSGKCKITLNDLAGRTVKEMSIEKNQNQLEKTIDVSDIAAGMYIVRFELPEGIAEKKLVKE